MKNMKDKLFNINETEEKSIFDEIKLEVTQIGNDEDCTFDEDYNEEYERIIEEIFGE